MNFTLCSHVLGEQVLLLSAGLSCHRCSRPLISAASQSAHYSSPLLAPPLLSLALCHFLSSSRSVILPRLSPWTDSREPAAAAAAAGSDQHWRAAALIRGTVAGQEPPFPRVIPCVNSRSLLCDFVQCVHVQL